MKSLSRGTYCVIALTIVLLIGVIGLLLAPVTPVVAETDEASLDTVSVTGTAEVKVSPDKSSAVVYIKSKASTAKEANTSLGTKTDAVIAALKSAGVKEENIQTSYFSIDESYRWVDGNRKSDGYAGESSLNVTGVDIDKIGSVIDAAVNAGADSVERVRYYSSNYDACYKDALVDAIADARAKADAMGQAAGFKVIRVHKMTEGYQNTSTRYVENTKADLAYDVAESAGATIAAGEVSVGAYVSIEYVIG